MADNIRFIEERVEQSRTELRGLAAQLDSLRRYHQEILSDLPIGACSLSSDRRVISWNMAIESISGIAAPRHGANPGQAPATLGQLCCTGSGGGRPAPAQGRPSRWTTAALAQLAQGEHPPARRARVILVEDLTDVQTLEAELAHSDRLASIGRLAAGVAHEIGNPVTGIACIAQNLKTESEDPRDPRAIVQITRRDGAHSRDRPVAGRV